MHRRDGESVDRMASKTRPINPHAAETMILLFCHLSWWLEVVSIASRIFKKILHCHSGLDSEARILKVVLAVRMQWLRATRVLHQRGSPNDHRITRGAMVATDHQNVA